MFVKKFEAPTLEDAIHLIKAEFGPNALILSTNQKNTKWYEKPRVEVTAAMEKQEEKKIETKLTREERASIDERKLAEIFPHRKEALFDGYEPNRKSPRSLRYIDIPEEEKPAPKPVTTYRKTSRERVETSVTANETEYVEHSYVAYYRHG